MLRLLQHHELERFLYYVEPVRRGRWVCWEWQGKRDRFGYGRFWLDGQWRSAHRLAFVGLSQHAQQPRRRRSLRVIPWARPFLDHRCNNESCVRPSHLQPVTTAENHRLRVVRGPYRTKRSLLRQAA